MKNPERFQWAFMARSAIGAYSDALLHGSEESKDVNVLADANPGNNSIEALCELSSRIALMMIMLDTDTMISLHNEFEVIVNDAIEQVMNSGE
jgi:hypothetical protein